MKRTIAFLLALVMLLSLMACGKKSEEAKTAEEPTEAAEASETAEAPETSGMTAGEEAAANESAAAGEDTDDGTIVENGIARTPCSSLDEINNALGGKLCKPVTVDSVDVSMELDKDENGVEFGTYIFSISDIYCGVRFSPDFNADLSGVVKEDGTSLFEGMEGDFTMEYMAEYCSMFVEEYNKHTGKNLTACEYKQELLKLYPSLKRWNLPTDAVPHADHPMKKVFIDEVNSLGIAELHVDNLYALPGSFINQAYSINGNEVKLLDDSATYWGTQVQKADGRCYGVACDERYILVSEYGMDGADAEIVLFKRR